MRCLLWGRGAEHTHRELYTGALWHAGLCSRDKPLRSGIRGPGRWSPAPLPHTLLPINSQQGSQRAMQCPVPVDKLFLNVTGLALPTFSPPACLGLLAKVLCYPVPLNHPSTPFSPRDFHSLPLSWPGTSSPQHARGSACSPLRWAQ